jgi:hypothetical protein
VSRLYWFLVLITALALPAVSDSATAQPYESVYVQGGVVSRNNSGGLATYIDRGAYSESPPDVFTPGASLRAGWKLPASRSMLMHFDLGVQHYGSRAPSNILRDMQPSTNTRLTFSEYVGDGKVTTMLAQIGAHYMPMWARMRSVQFYGLAGIGMQLTYVREYLLHSRYSRTGSEGTVRHTHQYLLVQSGGGQSGNLGGSLHGGLGLDLQFHDRYSLFVEMRGLFINRSGGNIRNVTPYVGVAYAINVDDVLGRF